MFRSLRARMALASFAATALTLLAVGGYLINDFDSSARERIDEGLGRRTAAVALQLKNTAHPPQSEEHGGPPHEESDEPEHRLTAPPPDDGPEGGDPQATYALRGQKILLAAGKPPQAILDTSKPGTTTVGGDEGWRVRVVWVNGRKVIAATSLARTTVRSEDLRNRALVIGGIGLVAAAAIGWLLAAFSTRSLRRLRLAADQVTGTEALDMRVPEPRTPEEVAALSSSLNAMLARIESSHDETAAARDTARQFAAEAGHELRTPLAALGTNLDLLKRGTGLDELKRGELVTETHGEYERIVRLLDSLQALARGDASADMPYEQVDLAEVAEAAVYSVHVSNPAFDFSVEAPDEGVTYWGHPEGLRRICENLLENAARHGKPNGTATLTIEQTADGAKITCDDDGPGIPPEERSLVVERFARGSNAGAGGSGLGLALVSQQATQHGGLLTITEGPIGGARIIVTLASKGGATQPQRHTGG